MSVSPNNDPISSRLVPWTRLPWPADWSRILDRDAPLALELGFGNGEFLERQVRERPEMNWVGAEISWASARRLLTRLERLPATNARVLVGDGVFLLEHLFDRGSLEEIHLNHPDPWPKKRHRARRVIQSSFVDLAARRLKPEGTLTVVTDHAGYADWIAEVLEGQTALRPAHGSTRLHELPGRTRTKYERKGREAGSRIHYFIWRKIEDGGPEPPHVETLNTMPNVMLEGTVRGRDLLPGFEPRTWTEERRGIRVLIQLLAVFARAGRTDSKEWLVEARVQEGGFTQHVGLSVIPRRDGRILIKPAPYGFPRPTFGLKQAVGRLAELILAAHPDLQLHVSTVGEVTKDRREP
jgi:tRNA (guanine-N7-)-methyltransferase